MFSSEKFIENMQILRQRTSIETAELAAKVGATVLIGFSVHAAINGFIEDGYPGEVESSRIYDCANELGDTIKVVDWSDTPQSCEPFESTFRSTTVTHTTLMQSTYVLPSRDDFIDAHNPLRRDETKRSESYDSSIRNLMWGSLMLSISPIYRAYKRTNNVRSKSINASANSEDVEFWSIIDKDFRTDT